MTWKSIKAVIAVTVFIFLLPLVWALNCVEREFQVWAKRDESAGLPGGGRLSLALRAWRRLGKGKDEGKGPKWKRGPSGNLAVKC